MLSSGCHETTCPLVQDITTRQESFFRTAKMTKSCSTEAMYSSAKSFMTLEESQYKATKTPNRIFVDARYLWVDVLMKLE